MEALQFSWWNVQGAWHFRAYNMSGRYAMHGWKVSRRYISAPTPLHARMPGDTAGVVLLGDTGKQTLGGRAWMRSSSRQSATIRYISLRFAIDGFQA